jgi:hypothetical protein
MRDTLDPAFVNIEQQINQLTLAVAQTRELAQTKRPQWVQNAVDLELGLRKEIGKIIAGTLATKLSAISALQPLEQKTLLSMLASYVKQRAGIAAKTLLGLTATDIDKNNKDITNKKIIFAAKLWLLFKELLDLSLTKENNKKLLKKLSRLSALERAEQAMTSSTKPPQPAPNSLLIPINIVYDYQISQCLNVLGLNIGAGHEEIQAAFDLITTQFNVLANPSTTDQQQYQLALSAHHALMRVENSKLVNLTVISNTELQELARNLRAQVPDLLTRTLTLQEIRGAVLETVIQKNLETPSPSTEIQIQQMLLTMEKLENKFAANPDQAIDFQQLNQTLQPAPSFGKATTPSPSIRKN